MKPTNDNAPQSATSADTLKKRAAIVAIVLVAALIPCMAIWNGMSNRAHGKIDVSPEPPAKAWGRLEYTPIVIAPPLEFAKPPRLSESSEKISWHIAKISPSRLSGFLKWLGVSAELSEQLVSVSSPNNAIRGSRINPSRQLILGMSPKDRTALYISLFRYWRNATQQRQFRFRGSSADEWFGNSGVSTAARKLVEPLIYRHGEFMYFSDFRSIEDSIPQEDRSNLLRALYRDATFLAHLKVSTDSDIEALVRYWGRGGRDNEVRPILEAIARRRTGRTINITHLLPSLARRKLYTYPTRSDSEVAAGNRDCHWTSMNFFNEEHDDTFCDGRKVADEKVKNYYRIDGNLQLGDIIVVLTSQMVTVHSAVYIADNVIFHKCGPESSTPWALARRKDIEGYYPSHQKYVIRYYRRKGV
jgi:hypothetical protein